MCLSRSMLRLAVPFLILLLVVPTFPAPPFEAVCEDAHTKAYRTPTYGDSGQQLSSDNATVGWHEGEKFQGGPWTFQYDPSVSTEFMTIDNGLAMVMDTHDHMLLVIKPNDGLLGEKGMMSYAIHTRLRVIAVTEVAGREGTYNSVKARVTMLNCEFHLLSEDYLQAEMRKRVDRLLELRRLRELMKDESAAD